MGLTNKNNFPDRGDKMSSLTIPLCFVLNLVQALYSNIKVSLID